MPRGQSYSQRSEARKAYRPKRRDEIRRNMSAIRSYNTAPERQLRGLLRGFGLRLQANAAGVSGTPDLTVTSCRAAVFLDGDFWHARLLLEAGREALKRRMKTANRAYWLAKFEKRVERDRAVNQMLVRQGYLVVRIWETDFLRSPIETAIRIAELLQLRWMGESNSGAVYRVIGPRAVRVRQSIPQAGAVP